MKKHIFVQVVRELLLAPEEWSVCKELIIVHFSSEF